MSKLPVISGKEAAKAFITAGWRVDRQVGSHLILLKTGSDVVLSIPLHKELKRGTLRKLIGLSGLTKNEFMEFLR
jgi:predicted RNA binding protein YcfA (HicA-like mRNA interferase family)